MNKYEPCPFCGSKKHIGTVHYGHMVPTPWKVECMLCGATGPWTYSEQGAVDAWNRRTNE